MTGQFGGHLFAGLVSVNNGLMQAGRAVPGGGGFTTASLTADDEAAGSEFAFRDLYAFPNPAAGGRRPTIRLQVGRADSVDIRIYDVSGDLVHSAQLTSPPRAIDTGNGKGPQFTQHYARNVGGVGSGIYLYAATAHRSGQADIKRIQKLGVVRGARWC